MESIGQRCYQPNMSRFDKRISREERLIAKAIKHFDYRSSNVLGVADDNIRLSRLLSYVLNDTNNKRMVESLKLAAKTYAAYFRLAQYGEQKQTIDIPGLPTVEHHGEGILEQGHITPNTWQKAYYTAVIVRDQESMDSLASFPVELIKSSSSIADDYAYIFVEAIQSYHHKHDDFVDLLKKAMKEASAVGDDWALDIALGQLEVLMTLATDIDYDFNEILLKNLDAHRTYYERNTEKDQLPLDSFIAIELLGMACQWHDKGNTVTAKSDYIPEFLINKSYL